MSAILGLQFGNGFPGILHRFLLGKPRINEALANGTQCQGIGNIRGLVFLQAGDLGGLHSEDRINIVRVPTKVAPDGKVELFLGLREKITTEVAGG